MNAGPDVPINEGRIYNGIELLTRMFEDLGAAFSDAHDNTGLYLGNGWDLVQSSQDIASAAKEILQDPLSPMDRPEIDDVSRCAPLNPYVETDGFGIPDDMGVDFSEMPEPENAAGWDGPQP